MPRPKPFPNDEPEYMKIADAIDAKICAEGVSLELVKDLFDCCIHESQNRRGFDHDFWFDKTARVKKYCVQMMGDAALAEEAENIFESTLLLEAPHLFESYLLYLEKDREDSEKFYEPKIKQFKKFGIIQALQDLEDDKLDFLTISMPPGTQKCQPLYSKVLTPDGFIPMGDIKIGSKVISGTGKVATVISQSEVKKRPVYEVTFDDGSKTRCSDNHIWHVQTRYDREVDKYRDVELKDMLDKLYVENGRRKNYSIDYVPKIDFPEKNFLLHPYIVGVLIGDGGLSQGYAVLSSNDKDIITLVSALLPDGYCLKHHDRCSHRVDGRTGKYSIVHKELDRLGLLWKKSIDKFIPEEYLYTSYEQRLWLLRGLLDTDGSAREGYVSFATISKQLAKDVAELVHSLGGYASCKKIKAGYKDKNGKYKRCHDAYSLIIQFGSHMDDVFWLGRKKKKYNPKRPILKRFISKVEYIGEENCKCILIDDPSHLYITDDYIITHNTTCEKFFASWIIGRHPKDYSLFFSHSSDITDMFYRGVLDITTSTEYNWREIFPDVRFLGSNAKKQAIMFNNYKPFANLQCTSRGSSNAGVVRCNRYLYVDDLIAGIQEALNKSFLDKLWNIYSVDARQRKLNEQVKEIHIATRWSTVDVIGRLQNLYGDSDRARFISIPDIDPVTGESNFDYKYNGMSTEFFNGQAMAMDEISYKCLYKNEPIEREGLLYHEDELRRFADIPGTEPDAIIAVCDTKSTGIDYMFMPVFYQYGTDFYLVDCICDNTTDFNRQYSRLTDMILKHNIQQCEFESNAGGDRIAFEVNTRVQAVGGRCNITSKATETNKETRIIVNSDWVKQHCLFKIKELYTRRDDYGAMMSFLLSYSIAGKNLNDDVPDGLANFSLYIAGKERIKPTQIFRSPI